MSLLLLFSGGAQPAEPTGGGGGGTLPRHVPKKLIDIDRDDHEVFEIIVSLIGSGILD
jgi:hypothetical protein